MRKTIAQQIENTFENDSSQAFLGGILLGETGKFTDVQYTQFIESGLVHLVAVSGGNMIFVMILLSILLFRMPFYLRMSVIGIALIGYALLCGGDSSVLRALVMSLL
jgi:competence protein ComEC